MSLRIGDKAPEVSLPDQNGVLMRSKDLTTQWLVLFFYPKDDTPGCTMEACSFRDKYNLFKDLNAVVWGVSSDTEKSHMQFAKKNQLPFQLLYDQDSKLRNAFGVPKTLGIIPGRVTYIINSKGIVCNIFINLLDGAAHVSNALETLKVLRKDK